MWGFSGPSSAFIQVSHQQIGSCGTALQLVKTITETSIDRPSFHDLTPMCHRSYITRTCSRARPHTHTAHIWELRCAEHPCGEHRLGRARAPEDSPAPSYEKETEGLVESVRCEHLDDRLQSMNLAKQVGGKEESVKEIETCKCTLPPVGPSDVVKTVLAVSTLIFYRVNSLLSST